MTRTLTGASVLALACASVFAQAPRNDLPPNPKLGECYARVVVPPQYESATEQVVTRPASKRIDIVPARYATVDETVVVREATKRLEIVPATYKTVTEEIVVRPAGKQLRTIPAVYEDVTERVLVREAYTTWKRGSVWLAQAKQVRRGVGTAVAGNPTIQGVDDDVLCLVEVPAEYRTVTRRVEKVRPSRSVATESRAYWTSDFAEMYRCTNRRRASARVRFSGPTPCNACFRMRNCAEQSPRPSEAWSPARSTCCT